MRRIPRGRLRRVATALVVVLVIGLTGCGDDEPDQADQAEPTEVTSTLAEPTTAEPRATTTTAEPLDGVRTATSVVQGQHPVYEAPDGAVKTSLPNPWVGTSPLVFLVKEQVGPDWLEVYLPVRPNGSTGFVKASDVSSAFHTWHIQVRLSEYRLIVTHEGETFLDTGVAVAAENTPTPGGLYYTTELRGRFDPSNAYGTYAYGLSGYSEVHTTFQGGPGQLGIHGTNRPELIGQRVSNGCIRMRNEDIEKLAPVLPLGVPVEVIP
jgi:lipoprotein-anchoring transpeptidase ErfK/SrfK